MLAAGIGARFGGVKQVVGVGPRGETLLEYSLFDARRAGFDHIVFLIRPEIEADFKANILSRLPASVSYSLAYQKSVSLLDEAARARFEKSGRAKPWGTGHALLCARKHLEGKGPFAVINADDYYGLPGFEKVGAHLSSSPGEFCFRGIPARRCRSKGRFGVAGDLSYRFTELSQRNCGAQESVARRFPVCLTKRRRNCGALALDGGLDEPLGV